MIDNQFQIKVSNLHWLPNTTEENDLCAHGNVFLKIGDEIVCDETNLEFTVSATALYLLRSLTENYSKDDYGSQFIPCCGFFTYFDKNDRPVISGCPSGIDWKIQHIDENIVKHISEKGTEATISMDNYQKQVFEFADKVEKFYKESKPKIIPDDDFERGAYNEIWEEWRNIRNR
ncbi:hypothetical protein [Chryseobacterium sp. MP_3.2]|uniref:hypothetical protein n=1 Tax=Chryseobacterium sp. MP_3.2 TaxID=3071712 RepID=UPI002E06792A|nr:hypothetical protein [Chryseobacterium sp. MP_3.2]